MSVINDDPIRAGSTTVRQILFPQRNDICFLYKSNDLFNMSGFDNKILSTI